ncbi:hypothetical protein QFZ66_007767 [Streptomyces sp. B4I13]|nr:hypothetical protein [Streptomyces sp. B4I13]MDQ0963889.1 hypothetical protein [Streptomyces sp. B4I13]
MLAIDDDGLHRLTPRRSGFRVVTSVCGTGGRLVLGSLWERGIAICEAPVIQACRARASGWPPGPIAPPARGAARSPRRPCDRPSSGAIRRKARV